MDKSRRTIHREGTRVGPCEIINLIGHGGMGDVYRAKHIALGKEVALKVLATTYAEKPEFVEGFLREAKLAARLEDAHIVQTYDVGSDGNSHYIVMQLARGMSLRERMRQGRPTVSEALSIIEQVAKGLSVAHSAGIVHRDIKPHNIILPEDQGPLKILDFGLARLERSLREPDQLAELVGSVAYMAPEQCDYVPVDARADIYALGVTAFQCLTGSLPFPVDTGGGTFETIARHQFQLASAPSLLNTEIPLTVSRVVLRMLEKQPEKRYTTVDEVLDELRLIRRHSMPATPNPWGERRLDPPVLQGGTANAERFRKALVEQRDHLRQGHSLTPLSATGELLGLEWEDGGNVLKPEDFLELVRTSDNQSVALSESAGAGGSYNWKSRFGVELDESGGLEVISVNGTQPIEPLEAQHLFDLLEALASVSAWPKLLRLNLTADYQVQAQDVRWVVEAFNLAAANSCDLVVRVGSTKNHDTFLQLGLDQHIRVELELQREPELTEIVHPGAEDALPSWLAEAGTLDGMGALPPAGRALVATIGRHIRTEALDQAGQAWRQLVGALRDGPHGGIRALRRELCDGIWKRGYRLYRAGDLNSAGIDFNTLVDIDPGRFEGHFGKGLVYKKLGKLDYASAFLTQAILAQPDNADLFYHRAIVRSRVGDHRGAQRDLNMAIEHNPRHANAYFNRAILHKKMNRPDLARRDMRIAQRLNPALREASRVKPQPSLAVRAAAAKGQQ